MDTTHLPTRTEFQAGQQTLLGTTAGWGADGCWETALSGFRAYVTHRLLAVEIRISRLAAAACLASALTALGALYVAPKLRPDGYGIHYVLVADHPLGSLDPLAHRLLTPLIAHLIGLGGQGVMAVNLFFSWLLLLLVYMRYRSKNWDPMTSAGVSALLAFSMPTLCILRYPCMTDSTAFVLILLMLWCVNRPIIYWGLFFLALFNRESIVVLAPFMILYQKRHSSHPVQSVLRSFLAIAISSGIYLAFRRHCTNMNPELGFSYYFGPLGQDPLYWVRKSAAMVHVGVFSAFKLFWILPAVGLWFAWKERDWGRAFLILAAIAGTTAQLFMAIDVSRLMCLAFPALLVGLEVAHEHFEERCLASFLWILIALNLVVPTLFVIGSHAGVMYDSFSSLLNHSLLQVQ